MMKQYFVLLLMSGTICMASESELISTHAMNRQLPDNSRKKLLAQHLTAALAITDTTQALQAVEDLLRIPEGNPDLDLIHELLEEFPYKKSYEHLKAENKTQG